jgi:hypothetical protein
MTIYVMTPISQPDAGLPIFSQLARFLPRTCLKSPFGASGMANSNYQERHNADPDRTYRGLAIIVALLSGLAFWAIAGFVAAKLL